MAFKYRLRYPDGTDAGEASYGDTSIEAGAEIVVSGNRRLRVGRFAGACPERVRRW